MIYLIAFWATGMMYQAHCMLGKVPDEVRTLFRVHPGYMFTAFIGMLAITWPLWTLLDIAAWMGRTWWRWRSKVLLKQACRELELEMIRAHDEKDKP